MSKTRYNEEEQKAFIHGYLYRTAEESKEKGLFEGMSTTEIARMFCIEAIESKKREERE